MQGICLSVCLSVCLYLDTVTAVSTIWVVDHERLFPESQVYVTLLRNETMKDGGELQRRLNVTLQSAHNTTQSPHEYSINTDP